MLFFLFVNPSLAENSSSYYISTLSNSIGTAVKRILIIHHSDLSRIKRITTISLLQRILVNLSLITNFILVSCYQIIKRTIWHISRNLQRS